MHFQKKYEIIPKYLTNETKRRSGILISPAVKFVVLHDTGSPNSTAIGNVRWYEKTNNEKQASAHIFVDDKEIIECVPALTTDRPEKAWHVWYSRKEDNRLFGYNANDVAIGVEYCYGNNINADEAYRRYVWVVAYICYKFSLNPEECLTAHCILDPDRRQDPKTGLAHSGRTYEKLKEDIIIEYKKCRIDAIKELEKYGPIKNPSITGNSIFKIKTSTPNIYSKNKKISRYYSLRSNSYFTILNYNNL